MSKTTYQQVWDCLHEYKATRNSDRLLMIECWRQEGLHLTPEQEQKFMKVASPESLRRSRQKIQSEGYFKPTDRVKRNRKELEYQQKRQAIIDTPSSIGWLYD